MPRRLRSTAFKLVLAFATLAAGSGAFLEASTKVASAQTAKLPGWLGIGMEASKGKPGVVVTHVVHSSPAEKVGLVSGDRIVKLDGSDVKAPGEVSAPVAAKGAGKSVTIDVVRGTKTLSFTMTLAPKPKPEQIFRMEMVGQKIALAPLTLVSGSGPTAYPGLEGHVVVIDVFATWCGPCAQATPSIQALHAKYSAQGLTVLGLSDEEPATLSTWTAKMGVGYTIVSDPSDAAFREWGAPALPSSLVIDKHGVVREVDVGFDAASFKHLEQVVQALLKEP